VFRAWSSSNLTWRDTIVRNNLPPCLVLRTLTNLLPGHVSRTSAIYFRLPTRSSFVLSYSPPRPHTTHHHLRKIPLPIPLFLSSPTIAVSAHGRSILPLVQPAHSTRPCLVGCESSWALVDCIPCDIYGTVMCDVLHCTHMLWGARIRNYFLDAPNHLRPHTATEGKGAKTSTAGHLL
jgi:hypothetical protein